MDNCEYCEGTGEVAVSGLVYANEPHTALIDTAPCLCQLDNAYEEN